MQIIIRCNKLTTIDEMLKALNWLSVKQQIIFNVMVLIYKISNKFAPNYLSEFLQRNNEIHTYNTCNNNDFRVVSSGQTGT